MFLVFAISFLLPISLAALPGGHQQGSAPPAEHSAPAASFASAQELAAKGHLDAALVQLDQLATQSPEPSGVERLRGMIFYQKEQFSQAIDAFAKATDEAPGDR